MGAEIRGGGGGSGSLADHTHSTTGDGGETINASNVTAHVLLSVGEDSLTSGAIRLYDASSSFRQTLTTPVGGLTADRSVRFGDIGGQVLMVGLSAVTLGTGTSSGNIGTVNVTGRTTAITSTGLTNATPAGLYMVSTQLACTTAGGAGGLTLTYTATTDGGSRAFPVTNLSTVSAGVISNTFPIYLTSGNITFATAFFGGGSGTYAVRIRCSFLS